MVYYVDDDTYSSGLKDPEMLSVVLSNQYETISKYMVSNKLVINDDKTQLLVLGTRVNKAIREQVSMQAGVHTIRPATNGKLLGCEVSDDLKWKHHILESEQSVIKQLTSRINGLVLVASRADFRTRLMVANGIVVSKLCYLIQLWGGCEGYLLHSLQVLQNRAARSVTGFSGFTSTRRLMVACGWLSVKQLVVFHTVTMVYKTLRSRSPAYLHSRLSSAPHPFRTRQSSTGSIRQDETFRCKSNLPSDSMRYRGTAEYNRIPPDIRAIPTLATFKTKLRQWVKSNIGLD